jgi:hypothetical protein
MALVSSFAHVATASLQAARAPRTRSFPRTTVLSNSGTNKNLGDYYGTRGTICVAPRRPATLRRSARLVAVAATARPDADAQLPLFDAPAPASTPNTFEACPEAPSSFLSTSSDATSKDPGAWWRQALQRAKAPTAALAIALVMLAAPLDAMAARSGGRMGGRGLLSFTFQLDLSRV